MREMTANEARLRSALEAALVALEVAADPANDIDPEGFAVVAKACRATLGCADYAACGTVVEGTTIHDAACPLSADNPRDESEPMLYCESLCCDNPCAGGRRQWRASLMRDGYCPFCAPSRAAKAALVDEIGRALAPSARPFDPRADAPEGALNARDVQELSLGSIVPNTKREADARAATFFGFGGGA